MNPSQGVRRFLPAVALFFVAGVASSPKAVADSETGGRKHAAKANHLAAKNKCKAAVPEFNRAYRTLKDPTLLFNRAECYRKLGQDDEALKDYQQFLADMPQAPNRAVVEARVASLRGTTAAPPASAAPTVAGKDLPAAPAKELAAPTAKPAVAPAKEPAAAVAKPAVVPTKEPVAPAVSPAKEPASPAAKPDDKATAVAPAKAPPAPAAKPAEKAAVAPAAPAAKPAEKTPAEPVRRAKKWED